MLNNDFRINYICIKLGLNSSYEQDINFLRYIHEEKILFMFSVKYYSLILVIIGLASYIIFNLVIRQHSMINDRHIVEVTLFIEMIDLIEEMLNPSSCIQRSITPLLVLTSVLRLLLHPQRFDIVIFSTSIHACTNTRSPLYIHLPVIFLYNIQTCTFIPN